MQINNAELEAVNKRFNEELKQQIEGSLSKEHNYKLGNPGNILQSAGIPNFPIELRATRLNDKSMQINHPFDLSEIKNLPQATQNPLAVFISATRIGSYVIMTEIEHEEKNYVVALQAKKQIGSIEINDIRSIHYRNSNAHIANWIDEELLKYVDKKRMSEWFTKQRYNSAEVRKLFGRAAKVIQNFENPKLLEENFLKNNDMNATLLKEAAIDTQLNWESKNEVVSNMRQGLIPANHSNEITYSERVLSELKQIKFAGENISGKTKIETSNDVAFLFRNLESAASENAFVVLHKENGDFNVLYLAT